MSIVTIPCSFPVWMCDGIWNVFASRMTPDFDPFAGLSVVRGAEPWVFARGGFPNAYLSGRNLGDEIAYVLADSGAKALELAKSKPFDLVLLDLGLPDMDGLDVLAALKAELAQEG